MIVLDDEREDEEKVQKEQQEEEEQEEDVPLRQKRSRVDDGSSVGSSNRDAAGPRASDATAEPPYLRPRRPLFDSMIRQPIASIGSSIRQGISGFTSLFSSSATHYTNTKQHHNTRSGGIRSTNPSYNTHTLSNGRWQHTSHPHNPHEHKHNDDDDSLIDRTFRIDDRAFHDTTEYLTYPPHTNRQSVTITLGDLHRLNPNEFLNDTLIEFYLLYIRDRIIPERHRSKFHFFNSFLFTRLSEYGGHSEGVREVYNQSVKKWTKGVNLFEKDWIVLPINDADRHHWSLVIIAHPGRAMRPKGLSIGAALTADRAKQKSQQQQQQQQQQHQAGGSVKREDNRKASGGGGGGSGSSAAGGLKRSNAASSSPFNDSSNSNTHRQVRFEPTQPSIPQLFAVQNSHPPSSLLALSAPLLTVPNPQSKLPRILRPRSQGEQMLQLVQQDQRRQTGKRATRSSHSDPFMSPENETRRRMAESKDNIRAEMHSPYSKHQHAGSYELRRKDDAWMRALAVPDEQPVQDTLLLPEREEMQTEEESAPAAAASVDVVPPYLYDDDVEFEVDEASDREESTDSRAKSNTAEQKDSAMVDQPADVDSSDQQHAARQAADADNDDVDNTGDSDNSDSDVPMLPRIAIAIPPTLPPSSQPPPTSNNTNTNNKSTTSAFSSSSSSPLNRPLSSGEPAEAGWRPCILHLDSLPIPPSQTKKIANILREYLQCEWEHQQQLQHITPPTTNTTSPPPPPSYPSVHHYAVPLTSPRQFTPTTFPQYDVSVPEQPNDYDCGVYILHFAELFCKEPWPDVRHLDREGWFHSRMQKEGDKRVRMREVVDHLRAEAESDEQFEKVKAESKRDFEREQREKEEQEEREMQQLQSVRASSSGSSSSSTRHKDVFVPDSDEDEGGEQKQEKVPRAADNSAAKRSASRRASIGQQRTSASDHVDNANEGVQSALASRSVSEVPSSLPPEDEYEF